MSTLSEQLWMDTFGNVDQVPWTLARKRLIRKRVERRYLYSFKKLLGSTASDGKTQIAKKDFIELLVPFNNKLTSPKQRSEYGLTQISTLAHYFAIPGFFRLDYECQLEPNHYMIRFARDPNFFFAFCIRMGDDPYQKIGVAFFEDKRRFNVRPNLWTNSTTGIIDICLRYYDIDPATSEYQPRPLPILYDTKDETQLKELIQTLCPGNPESSISKLFNEYGITTIDDAYDDYDYFHDFLEEEKCFSMNKDDIVKNYPTVGIYNIPVESTKTGYITGRWLQPTEYSRGYVSME